MTAINLSVVVLAWNKADLTASCLASIRANTDVPYELILVDNGSVPSLTDALADAGDTTVRHEANLGFAPGMNSGLAVASGKTIAFVNNDTVVPASWASRLLETLGQGEDAGIVLPVVSGGANPIAVRSEPGTDRIRIPPFRSLPSGVVYLLDTAVARRLGGWSEEYLTAGREDLDLLFKVWVNERTVVVDERVFVEHVGHATASELPNRDEIWMRNRQVFIGKWTNPFGHNIPRLASVDATSFAQNLERATTAAHWLQDRFAVEDQLEATKAAQRIKTIELQDQVRDSERRLRETTADLRKVRGAIGDPGNLRRTVGSTWSNIRSVVPAPIRQRLFPFFRKTYYRVYPDRIGVSSPPHGEELESNPEAG